MSEWPKFEVHLRFSSESEDDDDSIELEENDVHSNLNEIAQFIEDEPEELEPIIRVTRQPPSVRRRKRAQRIRSNTLMLENAIATNRESDHLRSQNIQSLNLRGPSYETYQETHMANEEPKRKRRHSF